MALIERLMGLNANGTEPAGHPDRPKISTHFFESACMEIIRGEATAADIKTALAMDQSEQDEFDAFLALTPPAEVLRLAHVMMAHSVLILAAHRNEYPVTGYDTPAGVRAKLGLT